MKKQYLGIKPRHSRGHDPDQFARRMVEHMNRSGLTAKLVKPLNEDETHGLDVRGARDTAHLADAYFDAIDAIRRGEAKTASAERTIAEEWPEVEHATPQLAELYRGHFPTRESFANAVHAAYAAGPMRVGDLIRSGSIANTDAGGKFPDDQQFSAKLRRLQSATDQQAGHPVILHHGGSSTQPYTLVGGNTRLTAQYAGGSDPVALILRKNGALHSRLGKTAGVRLNEVASALKDVVTRFPTIDHLKAYSRHAALNAGLVSHHLKRRELGDAAHAAAFTVLPPSHHTREDMRSMMGVSHKDWYRWGNHTGPDPIKTAAESPLSHGEIEDVLRRSLRRARVFAGLGHGARSAFLSGGLTAALNIGHPDQWATAAQMAGLGAVVGGGRGYYGARMQQKADSYRVADNAGKRHEFRGDQLVSRPTKTAAIADMAHKFGPTAGYSGAWLAAGKLLSHAMDAHHGAHLSSSHHHHDGNHVSDELKHYKSLIRQMIDAQSSHRHSNTYDFLPKTASLRSRFLRTLASL